ncbi:MAG TPA: CBS domain-containing protein [Rickettsiales bacterium]|nr:CBS domain-containing protein [Rickettsiales bacterium]
MQTKVRDIMKANPVIITSEHSLQDAAMKMEMLRCGILPVMTNGILEGVITDRDIVLRAVARGKDIAKEKVGNHMTTELFFCSEHDLLDKAAETMREHNVNRLLVKDRNGELRGILSFGAILKKDNKMQEISQIIECTMGKKAA